MIEDINPRERLPNPHLVKVTLDLTKRRCFFFRISIHQTRAGNVGEYGFIISYLKSK